MEKPRHFLLPTGGRLAALWHPRFLGVHAWEAGGHVRRERGGETAVLGEVMMMCFYHQKESY